MWAPRSWVLRTSRVLEGDGYGIDLFDRSVDLVLSVNTSDHRKDGFRPYGLFREVSSQMGDGSGGGTEGASGFLLLRIVNPTANPTTAATIAKIRISNPSMSMLGIGLGVALEVRVLTVVVDVGGVVNVSLVAVVIGLGVTT